MVPPVILFRLGHDHLHAACLPLPAKPDADGTNGVRNKVVDMGDVLATLAQAFIVDCTAP